MAAEPPLFFLSEIALTFGGNPLLEEASFQVFAGDRIALVGRNGSGKSTLLKIAAGMIEPDHGERFVKPGITTRYLPQEPDITKWATIGDYVLEGLAPGDDPYRGEMLLAELGLSPESATTNLSGGEARRAALARTLAPEPDILFLDEPTNHLDLPAIEWLETELSGLRSAIVLISHDRRFLEKLSRKTVWVDRGETRTLNEGFASFEDWRDNYLEQEELDRHKLDRKIVREEHWITHGVSGRRKRNMRRVRELADLRKTKAGEKQVAGSVRISTAEAATSGKLVADIKSISKAFGERVVVKDFSTRINRGDRLGIVGPNGAGKTTLVRLLTGSLEPETGSVRLGANLDLLLVDQKRDMLKDDWTLKDALTDGAGELVVIGDTTKHVHSYMKDFLFTPDQARTPIHALSGGERGRLMLARGLRTPSNLLVLDEPTNDLDLETLDLLQEFLADYPGTVILVSHDRDFLDRICSSVVFSDGDGKWTEYAGGYSDMVAQRGKGVTARKSGTSGSKAQKEAGKKADTKSTSPHKPENRLSFKQKHALETLPGEMERLEFEIKRLSEALAAPDLYSKEPKKFEKFTTALTERQNQLVEKEEEWLELEMLREETGG